MNTMNVVKCVYCQTSVHGIDGYKDHLCKSPFQLNSDKLVYKFQLTRIIILHCS